VALSENTGIPVIKLIETEAAPTRRRICCRPGGGVPCEAQLGTLDDVFAVGAQRILARLDKVEQRRGPRR
jgi:hypothetical protein